MRTRAGSGGLASFGPEKGDRRPHFCLSPDHPSKQPSALRCEGRMIIGVTCFTKSCKVGSWGRTKAGVPQATPTEVPYVCYAHGHRRLSTQTGQGPRRLLDAVSCWSLGPVAEVLATTMAAVVSFMRQRGHARLRCPLPCCPDTSPNVAMKVFLRVG